MQDLFLKLMKAVMDNSHQDTVFAFTYCGFGAMVQSSFLPQYALLFRSCRHAGAPGVE